MSDDTSTSSLHSLSLLDELDLCMLLLLLNVLEHEVTVLRANVVAAMDQIRREELTAQRAKPNTTARRKSFEQIIGVLSPKAFHRMFRMNRDSFDKLCENVIAKVGACVFKSEEWLISDEARSTNTATFHATSALGGTLSGEMKLGIMLRMLAGASYLDVLLTYGISTASVYAVFHEGTSWIVITFKFPFAQWITSKDEEALNRVAEGFSSDSGGVFRKCIGALDGLAVKIKCPATSDLIRDPGNYFCRKGFYALNVQAICDKSRRVLWMSSGHKGSTHDSTAFLETQLSKILDQNSDWLESKGNFIVGDSAYPLMGHLLVPYADAKSLSPEDAFNFWLSNSRIQIECAFGEVVMRWSILWRKLLFDIKDVGKVLRAVVLLHNFLVDERESRSGLNIEDAEYFRSFSLRDLDDRSLLSNEQPSAVATDNNEPHPGGRPNGSMINHQERGKRKREDLTDELYGSGRGRPMQERMHHNAHGQVYFS